MLDQSCGLVTPITSVNRTPCEADCTGIVQGCWHSLVLEEPHAIAPQGLRERGKLSGHGSRQATSQQLHQPLRLSRPG